ncbi:hypothetical protein BT96DRAFT_999552 [Gymnopus androsaceus JB14]|uniref:Uncharacterized protein n=1 Tax=Gymnopus androsaceus JB14 TaxID=1447944 RepID=A0A6A4H7X6_9AGAR|nr:hypothetical protein BT96DRAFT_999552 [Gymnopus androsaceus JB14]
MSLKYYSEDAQNWNTFVNLVLVWREHQAGNSMDGANGMQKHGAPPIYKQKCDQGNDVQRIQAAATSLAQSQASDEAEDKISAGLKNVELGGSNDKTPAQDSDGDASTDNEIGKGIPMFDAITRNLRDAEGDDEDSGFDSENDDVNDPDARLLANLFDYAPFGATSHNS